jgi:hypothetical protein
MLSMTADFFGYMSDYIFLLFLKNHECILNQLLIISTNRSAAFLI